ncbi:MAG: DNA-processing protein DprA [Anditalea sp.]
MLNPANDVLLYNIALSLIPQIGPGVFKNIISYSGSSKNFFLMPNGKAEKIPGIGPKLLFLRKQKSEYLRFADEIINDCIKRDIRIHSYLDQSYASRLKPFSDSPVFVFSKGNINLNPDRTIGIVGTRNASDYGKSITRRIVEDLAPYGPTVISGLAYGIDIEAHRAALQFDLPTIGILGTPMDKIYPASHTSTAQSMMEKGGLVTEYRIGSELNKANFPQRNRIIAALSDALIIVEAAIKGGALITAEIAYSYNKEVFAVPGNLQSHYSEGCNNLIRTMKAGIYMGPKEIEEALSWNKGKGSPHKSRHLELGDFEPEEQLILQLLSDHQEVEIDQLSWLSHIPLSILASKLLNLEFQGVIKSIPGKKYRMV